MTSPDGSSPAGSLATGLFASWQAQTEGDAKSAMNGAPLNAWGGAQDRFHQEVATTFGMYREVTRLDNRIDEIVIGNQKVLLATFSTSGTWTKPKGATRVVVNVLAGSSGGGRSNNGGNGGSGRGGLGGFSGGWSKQTINATTLPDTVAVTVGSGGSGASSDGGTGSGANGSSFGTWVTSDGASPTQHGLGTLTFRIRGGNGGMLGFAPVPATVGGDGSFHPGGEPGKPDGSGNAGVNGFSVNQVGQIGMGSGGGGGAAKGFTGSGGRGGDGGWPSGPGGGGGAYESFGTAGNGGNGAGGAVFVMTYLEDTFGLPPSAPTNLQASNVTRSGAKITWTASTDDVVVAKYEVLVDGFVTGDTTGVDFELAGLSPSTSYQVAVRAVDLGSNRSDPSSAITVTTAA